jgi:hypothetical protein
MFYLSHASDVVLKDEAAPGTEGVGCIKLAQ